MYVTLPKRHTYDENQKVFSAFDWHFMLNSPGKNGQS